MTANYPNDADGEALRRIAEDGSNMSKPMLIDFHVAAPNESAGKLIIAAASEHHYDAELVFDDEEGESWTVWCKREMIPEYEAIIRSQKELDALSEPFGGYSDGWGSFGNK